MPVNEEREDNDYPVVPPPPPLEDDYIAEPFLLLETTASDWATNILRPLTPPRDETKPPEIPPVPSSHAPFMRDDAREELIWTDTRFVLNSVIRPWVSDLGWRVSESVAAHFNEPVPVGGASIDVMVLNAPLMAIDRAIQPLIDSSPSDLRFAVTGLPTDPDEAVSGRAPGHGSVPPPLKDVPSHLEHAKTYERTLMESAASFDTLIATGGVDSPTRASPSSASKAWRRSIPFEKLEPETHDRPTLAKVEVKVASTALERDSSDCLPMKGQVACPSSPAKGNHPRPPHLENAKEPVARPPIVKPMRATSAEPLTRFDLDTGLECIPVVKLARPGSAKTRLKAGGAKVVSGEQMPAEQRAAADLEAAAIKRYLSRSCGRIEVALQRIDTVGRGCISREAWAVGLEKLGYKANSDVQDAFTVLDKRSHHVLTLSDFQGGSACSVDSGRKPEGLLELSSEIFCETLDEQFDRIVSDVLSDMLAEELLAPHPRNPIPDIKKWLKKREQANKAKTTAKQQKTRKTKKSGASAVDGEEDEECDEDGSPDSRKGKKKKQGKSPSRPGTRGVEEEGADSDEELELELSLEPAKGNKFKDRAKLASKLSPLKADRQTGWRRARVPGAAGLGALGAGPGPWGPGLGCLGPGSGARRPWFVKW